MSPDSVLLLEDVAASHTEPAGIRLTAVDALTRLPPASVSWSRLAQPNLELLRQLESSRNLGEGAAQILARVPLPSLREELTRISSTVTDPAGLACTLALADQGDLAALPALIERLPAQQTPDVLRRLAALAGGHDKVLEGRLRRVLVHADPQTRVWAAIALARMGVIWPFERMWKSVAGLPEPIFPLLPFTKKRKSPMGVFSGDPWTPYGALLRVRPLPDSLTDFLLQSREEVVSDGKELPRDAQILVGGLTGRYDAEGHPVEAAVGTLQKPPDPRVAYAVARRLIAAPYEGARVNARPEELQSLQALDPELALRVLSAGIDALSGVPESSRSRERTGNALLELARHLPRPLPLPLPEWLESEALGAISPSAANWVLGLASPQAVIDQLAPGLVSQAGAQREERVTRIRDILASQPVSPPLEGSGPSSVTPWRVENFSTDSAAEAPIPPSSPSRGAPPPPSGPPSDPTSSSPPDPPGPTNPGSAPAALRDAVTVFPRIDASDEHPVAGSPIDVEVWLADTPMPGVAGRATLPPSDEVLTLDVHLLAGTTSAWETLQYSHSKGTVMKARFTVAAPSPANDGETPTLRANFYLGRRWCGEARRNLDVRKDASVAPDELPPLKEKASWEEGLRLEPGAQPPDLIVRIQRTGVGQYVWTCQSPHIRLPAPTTPSDSQVNLGRDAETFVRDLFEPLTRKPLDKIGIAEVEGIGEVVYQSTPVVFRNAYWALWHAAHDGRFDFESVLFVTDEPCVPWELMRVSDDERGQGVAPEFLSIQHSVGRWLARESARLAQSVQVSQVAVAASDYNDVAAISRKLPGAARERDFLKGKFTTQCLTVTLNSSEVMSFLEAPGRAGAVHFACHGQMSIAQPLNSLLYLEDTPKDMKPSWLTRGEVRSGLGSAHPMVFLNACQVGSAASALSLVAGFPAAFINAGASAVISPLWVVNDDRAEKIAQAFYGAVLDQGIPVGRALRDIRASWKREGHLTYLAYVLYGDPLVRAHYSPPLSAAGP